MPVAVLLIVLATTSLLTTIRSTGPAGADQVSDLQAQARTLAQQLVQAQLEVGAYQQQYSVVQARVAADGRAMAQLGRQMAEDEHQIAARQDTVRSQAIRAYTNYGTTTGAGNTALFGGSQETVQAASEYSSIAVGNITTALDQLHLAQRALGVHQAQLAQQRAADQAEQGRQAQVLTQADASAGRLSSLHAQVTGQLASAIAAQQAVQARAAAAALASATRARSAPPSVASVTSSSGTASSAAAPPPVAVAGSGAGVADPALNSFLQCVVMAESGGNYGAVSPNGEYMGAFQFSQSTWNIAAQAAGLAQLVGVPPNRATKAQQDAVAVALYAMDGQQPWLGDRCAS